MTICCLFSDCRKHSYNKDNDLLAVIYEAEWFSLRKNGGNITFLLYFIRAVYMDQICLNCICRNQKILYLEASQRLRANYHVDNWITNELKRVRSTVNIPE